jgi:hypothetical protein
MTAIFEWTDIPEGMPRFGLRGDDPEAPAAILFWAQQRRLRLLRAMPEAGDVPETINRELQQCSRAEQIAWEMQAFQRTTDMSKKDATYHVAKLAEAQKITAEALLFARTAGVDVVRETIERGIRASEKLAEKIIEKIA